MTAFQQIAAGSRNLLDDERLSRYGGAVLSPINYLEDSTSSYMERLRLRRPDFAFVFDPQLYYPHTKRGVLREWSYFPNDFDSSDRTSLRFWNGIVKNVAKTGKELRARFVASPADVPRVCTNAYYVRLVELGATLARLSDDRFEPMQSVIVRLSELDESNRALQIASIVSEGPCKWIYLLIDANQRETREIGDDTGSLGVMKLIHSLEAAGRSVLVAYCSSDVLLWKAAGASMCATGKYFNVRRLTASRFEPKTSDGGGSADYWFEESLLAFLKQIDVLRFKKENLLAIATMKNPLLGEVDVAISRGQRWTKVSWVQYMEWFADVEERLSTGVTSAEALIDAADEKWKELDRRQIVMADRYNDGSWVRRWKQAILDFKKWRQARDL